MDLVRKEDGLCSTKDNNDAVDVVVSHIFMGREIEARLGGGGVLLGVRGGTVDEALSSDDVSISLWSLLLDSDDSVKEYARFSKRRPSIFFSGSSLDREGGTRKSGVERS